MPPYPQSARGGNPKGVRCLQTGRLELLESLLRGRGCLLDGVEKLIGRPGIGLTTAKLLAQLTDSYELLRELLCSRSCLGERLDRLRVGGPVDYRGSVAGEQLGYE